MKIKSIKVVRIKLPNVNTDQKPRRPSWANFSKRAMPLNYYSEFSRLPKEIPGNKLDNVWVKATAEDGTWGLGQCGFGENSENNV